MLTIYTLKSAGGASKYYQKDTYYTQEGHCEVPYSVWQGKGADSLGLQGKVDFAQFQQVLEGNLPNGIQMLQKQSGGRHRPGYDLTFSAPKSVSILGIVGQDERVIQAHREAVSEVLSHIEKEYATVRSKKNGAIQLQKTDNLSFATFEHTDSRELDPNLHTHCILMNFTQRQDGQWRTIYGDELYKDKLLNGMEYRVALAKALKTRGFELVQTSEKGTFELANFDEKLIKQFSKRRLQIEDKLSEMGQSGGKIAQVANFITRKNKENIDPSHIHLRWEHELKVCGSNMEFLQRYSKEAQNRCPIMASELDGQAYAMKSVDSAIRHLSERNTVFSMKEVLKSALGLSLLHCDRLEVMQALSSRVEKDELIYLGEGLLTTQAAQDAERKLGSQMQQDKKQVKPLCGQLIAGVTSRLNLNTKNQRGVLKHLLTNTDRQTVIQTTVNEDYYKVLKVLNKVCKENYYYPIGISSSSMQAEHLKNQTGLSRAYTIGGFLEACNHRAIKTNGRVADKNKQYEARQVWLIDPSTKMNIKQGVQLQEWAKHFGARIVWSGKATPSNPILSLFMKEGVKSVSLGETLTRDNQKEGASDLIQALNHLQSSGQIHQSSEYQQRIEHATESYLSMASRDPVLLVTTQSDRTAMNQAVREKLIASGELGKESIQIACLKPLSLSEEQKSLAHLYQQEDIVHFRAEYKKIRASSDSYYSVQAIDFKNGTLTLEGNDGTSIQWDPAKTGTKQVTVYRTESRELRVGDQLVWTKNVRDKNDVALDRRLGEKAQVVSIEDGSISLNLQNGKSFDLNPSDLRQLHLEHGYATLVSSHHKAAEDAVLMMTSQQASLVDDEALASIIKQSKTFSVVCDDIKAVQDNLLVRTKESRLATQKEGVPYDEKSALAHVEPLIKASLAFSRLRSAVEDVIEKDPQAISRVPPSCLEMDLSLSHHQKTAYDAVDYVCSRLVERNAVFNLKEARAEVYNLVGLNVPKERIEEAFRVALDKGLLVNVNRTAVTTQGMMMMEKACLQSVKEGQDTLSSIFPSEHLSLKDIERHERLTTGQKEAIMLSLTTSDRVIGIQGVAGVGKTTMLKEVNRLCGEAGFRVMGLANTAGAKNRITEATNTLDGAGIPAMTTRKFLNHAEKLLSTDPELAKSTYGRNQILVLDEVSLASTRDLFSLLLLVQRLDARLLLMGDLKQLGPIEAGNPWHLLLGSDMKSVSMTENVRFNDPQTVAIMKDLYAARIDDAIDKLALNTVEIPDKDKRLEAIAALYMGRTKEEQAKTLVISPKNEDRIIINDKIRTLLEKNGTLHGAEIKVDVLLPKDMNQVEKQSFYAYEEKEFIKFNFNSEKLGIKRGEYLKIFKKDPDIQLLVLENSDGRHIHWFPRDLPKWSGAIEVFEQDTRGLMAGDTLRWRRNDESRGIINGEVAEVLKAEGATSQVRLRNGETIEINLKERANQHWDHAYTSTVFVAQGQDVAFTIGLCQGPKPYIGPNGEPYYPPISQRKPNELPLSTTLSGFLVMATRGDGFVMFVDDIKSFKDTLEANSGLKETAMKHLDPEWSNMAKKVEKMTENVTGRALKEEPALKSSTHPATQKTIKKMSSLSSDKKALTQSSHGKKDPFINKETVIHHLHANILEHVIRWRGEPSHVTQREARWGKRGSFSVLLRGEGAGTWSDFERGTFGRDLLSLYIDTNGVSFKEALMQLSKDDGKLNEKRAAYTNQLGAVALSSGDKDKADFNKNKIEFARKTYEKGVHIRGTLAEKYLQEHRGIKGDLPNDFRFCSALKHPHTQELTPALLAPIRDKQGNILGVVRIFLEPDGSKLNVGVKDMRGQEVKAASKANLGLTRGGAVTVQQGALPHTLWVAEGVETALSVAKARPEETVLASLSVSQLKSIPVDSEQQKIVICADNDGEHSHTKKTILQAVEHHLSQGSRVFIAIPPGNEKCDFNDVLRRDGLPAVERILDQKVEIKDSKQFDQAYSQLRDQPLQSMNAISCLKDQKPLVIDNRGTKELMH